jgi:hypothetical protein
MGNSCCDTVEVEPEFQEENVVEGRKSKKDLKHLKYYNEMKEKHSKIIASKQDRI